MLGEAVMKLDDETGPGVEFDVWSDHLEADDFCGGARPEAVGVNSYQVEVLLGDWFIFCCHGHVGESILSSHARIFLKISLQVSLSM